MVTKYSDIGEIIYKINTAIGEGSLPAPWQTYVEWIADGLRHIGAFGQYEEINTKVDIKNYKGTLPCGFIKLRRIENAFEYNFNPQLVPDLENIEESIKAIKFTDKDFNINKNTIITSFKEGAVGIVYLGMPVNEKTGYPLVPYDPEYEDALFWKVVYQLSLRGFEFKQPRLRDCEYTWQKWQAYCLGARGSANMPDQPTMELIVNQMMQLKPIPNQYYNNSAHSQFPPQLDL